MNYNPQDAKLNRLKKLLLARLQSSTGEYGDIGGAISGVLKLLYLCQHDLPTPGIGFGRLMYNEESWNNVNWNTMEEDHID